MDASGLGDSLPGEGVASERLDVRAGCQTYLMQTCREPLRVRLRLVLLAVLTALATLLSPAVLASASGVPAAETRLGAIHPTVTVVVGAAEHIAAGQRRSRAPSQLRPVSGHCVAAEGEGTVLSRLRARMADDTGSIGLPAGSSRLTNSQAGDLADWLGYRATKFRSHGQRIFTNGKSFITQDVDSHVGGTWKMANSVDDLLRGNRIGTYDYELNWIAP